MATNRETTTHRRAARPRRGAVSVVARLFQTWRTRVKARRALARLDDHMLRDIGLDRLTANREVSRRFWQD